MNYQARLAMWPRLAVTSVHPTDELISRFSPRPPRILMFNGEPLGVIDLVLQVPLMGGLDGLQYAGAMSMLLAEILDAMTVPAGETVEAQAARRAKVLALLEDAADAVNTFTQFCGGLEAANVAAKNSITGKVRPS